MYPENKVKTAKAGGGKVSSLLDCSIAPVRVEVIGDCTLYLGDCGVILPQLPDFDLILTDPPYGIGESGGDKKRRRGYNAVVNHTKKTWDTRRPQKKYFDLMSKRSATQIIWGGNYFADLLPPSMGWLYWDKKMGGDFSDGELAWTSRNNAVRDFSKSPFEGLRGGHDRQHPTQKATSLMTWCLFLVPDAKTVCDPFMGSGTTGVACVQQGLKFVGIEQDLEYFDIACKRISQAEYKPRLFKVGRKKKIVNDEPKLF